MDYIWVTSVLLCFCAPDRLTNGCGDPGTHAKLSQANEPQNARATPINAVWLPLEVAKKRDLVLLTGVLTRGRNWAGTWKIARQDDLPAPLKSCHVLILGREGREGGGAGSTENVGAIPQLRALYRIATKAPSKRTSPTQVLSLSPAHSSTGNIDATDTTHHDSP